MCSPGGSTVRGNDQQDQHNVKATTFILDNYIYRKYSPFSSQSSLPIIDHIDGCLVCRLSLIPRQSTSCEPAVAIPDAMVAMKPCARQLSIIACFPLHWSRGVRGWHLQSIKQSVNNASEMQSNTAEAVAHCSNSQPNLLGCSYSVLD